MKILLSLVILTTLAFPLRIISSAPSITETIFALGGQKNLIAVSKYCNYPLEAKSLPSIGGHYDFSRELFILKNPELVMLLKGNTSLKSFLKEQSIPYAEYDNESIHGLMNMITDIGERLNQGKAAKTLTAKLSQDIEHFKLKYKNSKPVKVLLIVEQVVKSNSLNAVYILGQEDFYTPLLQALNMENVYDGKMKYPMISKEALIHYNPEVIIVLGEENIKAYEDIPIQAIKDKKLYFFEDDYFKRPGPRFTKIMEFFSTVREI